MLCEAASRIVGDKHPADWTKEEIRAVVAANVAELRKAMTKGA